MRPLLISVQSTRRMGMLLVSEDQRLTSRQINVNSRPSIALINKRLSECRRTAERIKVYRRENTEFRERSAQAIAMAWKNYEAYRALLDKQKEYVDRFSLNRITRFSAKVKKRFPTKVIQEQHGLSYLEAR